MRGRGQYAFLPRLLFIPAPTVVIPAPTVVHSCPDCCHSCPDTLLSEQEPPHPHHQTSPPGEYGLYKCTVFICAVLENFS
jgi:hypothetical protein